ncbi:hypothetical protein OSB04_019522 [Centaurea solstitialis]|uniref:Retrotransposon protein, putative, Ty1-copia subclass n=1 Tax=Centaurea solstitialis TaxID=347529 RepID=A0AA38WEC6_9ASTR|nr:hypothetical protein OSB04_019522 [Centaurea solstitialis]
MFLVFGGSEDEISVTGYTNTTFQADREDFRSQSGYVFTLNGGAISWKSSKQDTIADSTTDVEYIAASDAAKEAVWLRNFMIQGGFKRLRGFLEILGNEENDPERKPKSFLTKRETVAYAIYLVHVL